MLMHVPPGLNYSGINGNVENVVVNSFYITPGFLIFWILLMLGMGFIMGFMAGKWK